MKRMRAMMLAALILTGIPALAQNPGASPPGSSPAEKRIAASKKRIERAPKLAQNYNDLAMACAARARETADPAFYHQAIEAIAKSLELAPDNLEARKAEVWVLLGQHEFVRALELAKKLNRRWPDDVLIYGFLVDANAELGNYKDAEEAAQWMLDLRPGNVPGLTRAAYLRELFGDVDGALELMTQAFQRTQPQEVEDRAWLLTQMAHLHLSAGNLSVAEQLLSQAFRLFPDYHYSLAQLAKVRTAQGRHAEAADLFRRRYAAAPHPENLFDLAAALERAGRTAEARAAFADFEKSARAEMNSVDNANRELAAYYVDHARKPLEALRVAEAETARRRDVFTLDAYAWALSAAGRHPDAQREIQQALAVGVRDAKMLYHAGVIASRAKKTAEARRFLNDSIKANPHSEVVDGVRSELRRLTRASGRTAGK